MIRGPYSPDALSVSWPPDEGTSLAVSGGASAYSMIPWDGGVTLVSLTSRGDAPRTSEEEGEARPWKPLVAAAPLSTLTLLVSLWDAPAEFQRPLSKSACLCHGEAVRCVRRRLRTTGRALTTACEVHHHHECQRQCQESYCWQEGVSLH